MSKGRGRYPLTPDEWIGTDLPGRQMHGRPPAGPHQGLPGKPIDPTSHEKDEPDDHNLRDDV